MLKPNNSSARSVKAQVNRGILEGECYADDMIAEERRLYVREAFPTKVDSADKHEDPPNEAQLYANGCADELYD